MYVFIHTCDHFHFIFTWWFEVINLINSLIYILISHFSRTLSFSVTIKTSSFLLKSNHIWVSISYAYLVQICCVKSIGKPSWMLSPKGLKTPVYRYFRHSHQWYFHQSWCKGRWICSSASSPRYQSWCSRTRLGRCIVQTEPPVCSECCTDWQCSNWGLPSATLSDNLTSW